MDFVSLSSVVASIAETLDLEPHGMDQAAFADAEFATAVKALFGANNKAIEWQRKLSIAALILNRELHHREDAAPRWMEYDKEKRFAVWRDTVRDEGIALLTAQTTYGGDLLERLCANVRTASAGHRTDLLDYDFVKTHSLAWLRQRNLRDQGIGFDRSDAVRFLKVCGIAHRLSVPDEIGENDSAEESSSRQSTPPASSRTQMGLSTDDVVTAFRDVGKTGPEWIKLFQRRQAGWLKKCLLVPGRQGINGVQAIWDPVAIGQALVNGGARPSVPLRQVTSAFNTRTVLKPFRVSWSAYLDDRDPA